MEPANNNTPEGNNINTPSIDSAPTVNLAPLPDSTVSSSTETTVSQSDPQPDQESAQPQLQNLNEKPVQSITPPVPTTPSPLETPTSSPENLNEKPATPEKSKKQGNPNTSNYVIAGVSVGIIIIIVILICGAIFGGWFGNNIFGSGFTGGPITSFIFGATIKDSSDDIEQLSTIAKKVTEKTVSSSNDPTKLETLVTLDTRLKMYQTNNRGNLPAINSEWGEEYTYDGDYDNTEVTNFYQNYIDDDFMYENGSKYSLHFFTSPERFCEYGYDEDDLESTLSTIFVFYNATCGIDDAVSSLDNPRSYALTLSKSDYSSYYCVDSGHSSSTSQE